MWISLAQNGGCHNVKAAAPLGNLLGFGTTCFVERSSSWTHGGGLVLLRKEIMLEEISPLRMIMSVPILC